MIEKIIGILKEIDDILIEIDGLKSDQTNPFKKEAIERLEMKKEDLKKKCYTAFQEGKAEVFHSEPTLVSRIMDIVEEPEHIRIYCDCAARGMDDEGIVKVMRLQQFELLEIKDAIWKYSEQRPGRSDETGNYVKKLIASADKVLAVKGIGKTKSTDGGMTGLEGGSSSKRSVVDRQLDRTGVVGLDARATKRDWDQLSEDEKLVWIKVVTEE